MHFNYANNDVIDGINKDTIGKNHDLSQLESIYLTRKSIEFGAITKFDPDYAFRYNGQGYIEALYDIPLPFDAAIYGGKVTFAGGVARDEGESSVIPFNLVERGKAMLLYDEAKKNGSQACVLSQEAPYRFSLSLTGLTKEITKVTIKYVLPGSRTMEGFEFPIPLTVAPRCGDDADDGTRVQLNRNNFGSFPHRYFGFGTCWPRTGSLRSPSHRILECGEGTTHLADLHADERERNIMKCRPDRDFLLQWVPSHRKQRVCAFYREPLDRTIADESQEEVEYFATIFPPKIGTIGRVEDPQRPIESILLIDGSFSMKGRKWEIAVRLAELYLRQQNPNNLFNVIIFGRAVDHFRDQSENINERTILGAMRLIHSYAPSGDTNLSDALAAAIKMPHSGVQAQRRIIVMTDAQVYCENILQNDLKSQDIYYDSTNRLNEDAKIIIDVVCIDSSPNRGLATDLAIKGCGECIFLSTRPTYVEVLEAVNRLRSERTANLPDTTIIIDREVVGAINTDFNVRNGKSILHPPARADLWVVGAMRKGADAKLEALLKIHGRSLPLEVQEMTRMKELYGHYLLKDQGAKLPMTNDLPNPKSYSLQERQSIKYGSLSQATCFIAISEELNISIDKTVKIRNTLPLDWMPR